MRSELNLLLRLFDCWGPFQDEQLRIPSVKSRRINVLGFMNRDNDLFYYPVVGSVTGDEVVRVFDDFAEKMQDQKYSANAIHAGCRR